MRTFAMRVYSATYWVLVLTVVYVFAVFMLPQASSPEVAAFLPVMAAFLGLFVLVAILATAWQSAPRRPRFWLAGLVPPVLFLLMNAPYIPFALTHPTDSQGFVAALPLTVGAIVVAVAGIRAYRDARENREIEPIEPRTAAAVGGTAAFVVGAVLTSIMAGSAAGAGSIPEATAVDVLQAKDTKWVETSFEIKAGERLALVVVNRDAYAHSFDIDSLGIHVNLPANSSTTVAVETPTPGTVEFYCAVPGHPEAGMVGTIVVN